MRFVFYGLGAIGGGLAAMLARSGRDVIGIARGAQLDAVRAGGLRVRAPEIDTVVKVPCVGAPTEIEFRPDDVIFLAMKTQDNRAALEDLQKCGVADQPIVCTQNGIENERLALRFFPNVYAAVVMMPADFVKPGEVVINSGPKFGVFNIGRYPRGVDKAGNQGDGREPGGLIRGGAFEQHLQPVRGHFCPGKSIAVQRAAHGAFGAPFHGRHGKSGGDEAQPGSGGKGQARDQQRRQAHMAAHSQFELQALTAAGASVQSREHRQHKEDQRNQAGIPVETEQLQQPLV